MRGVAFGRKAVCRRSLAVSPCPLPSLLHRGVAQASVVAVFWFSFISHDEPRSHPDSSSIIFTGRRGIESFCCKDRDGPRAGCQLHFCRPFRYVPPNHLRCRQAHSLLLRTQKILLPFRKSGCLPYSIICLRASSARSSQRFPLRLPAVESPSFRERMDIGTFGTVAHHSWPDKTISPESLCEQGRISDAVNFLFQRNKPASAKTYISLLQACNRNKKDLTHATRIYTHMVQHNAPKNAFLGDYLAMTLAKSGALEDACRVAYSLRHRSVLTWTAIISAYSESGYYEEAIRLHKLMLDDGVEPNSYTYVSLLKACGNTLNLETGTKIHAEVRTRGLATHIFVGSTLVSMYGKCGALAEAEDVFLSLSYRDPVSWNAMLTAYVDQRKGDWGLQLFRQMLEENVVINDSTLILALQALADLEDSLIACECANIRNLGRVGEALHSEVSKRGLSADIMVGSALLSMYGKYGMSKDVDNVFVHLLNRDVVSWNAAIAAYVDLGNEERALHFYRKILEDGLNPDMTTFLMVCRACSNLAEKNIELVKGQPNRLELFEIGQALHTDARTWGYASDPQVANTLVCMYGKCGAISHAEDVFSELQSRDVVSWTVLLSAFAEQGYAEKALELYKNMERERVVKDDVAFVSALQACGAVGAVETCRQLHFEIVSVSYDGDLALVTTLIVAFRSCAFMADAQECFKELSLPTSVLWNACMAGHAGEGGHVACLGMFEEMKAAGFQPNDLTFISALCSCRNTGLVGSTVAYFESLTKDYGLTANAKHYGVILDLLGRVGDFKRILKILQQMPWQADAAVWLSLIGACTTHGELELAQWAFERAVELQPEDIGPYVLLLNVCQDEGLQDLITQVDCLQSQGAALFMG